MMKKKDSIVFLVQRTKTTVAISSFLFLLGSLIADLNMGGVYSASGNIFKLFDLKQEKKISRERCIKGLQTMANSSFQFEMPLVSKEIPLEVDENCFVELCRKFMGFANQEM